MTDPLPYTIRDIMLDLSLPCFVRKYNRAKVLVYQAREVEFKETFGIDLIFFIHPLAGFDYCKFAHAVLDPVPDGISYNTATASRFSPRAAELIGELIHAGSGLKGEKDG